MEDEGYCILKLNIGNFVLFGFDVLDDIFKDVIYYLLILQGYLDFIGIYVVCVVVMQYYQ